MSAHSNADSINAVSRKKRPGPARDRDATEAALIEAVGSLLAKRGFGALGVNAIAREAGADKVLIYRYFGDLDGLYRAFAQGSDFWPSAESLLDGMPEEGHGDPAVFLRHVYGRLADALRDRPLTLEILAWETIERNSLTVELEALRERSGQKLMRFFVDWFGMPAQVDIAAFASLYAAAIQYLAVRARKIRTYNGIDIKSDAGWQRLVDAIALSASSVFDKTAVISAGSD